MRSRPAPRRRKNPKRDLPIAIVGSLVICTIIYMLVSIAAVGSLDAEALAESDAPLAARARRGRRHQLGREPAGVRRARGDHERAADLFYGQTRIFFAMARDGLMPRGIAKVNPRTGTPVHLTIGMGVAIAVLAALVPLSEIVKLVNIGTLFAFLLVNIGVIILRSTHPDMERPFRVPFCRCSRSSGRCLIIYLMTKLPGETWIRFVVWLALGMIMYYFYGRHHSLLQRAIKRGETQ